jgi:DHA1 family tetracycline resistance protein-like MFS transporter
MADTDPSTRREAAALSRTTLGVVFTTILIDFIGFSVLFPVLPLFAERLGATPFQVGLIVTLYALAQLVFLPVWGWISDRVGRRPVLLISLLGTTGSFLLLAATENIAGIYLARGLAGFFAASIGTAQAVVTDVTLPSERAGGMGIIGAAFGAGMVVGPMLGGSLAIIDVKAPFYAIAILSGANFLVALRALPESRPPSLDPPRWGDLARSFIPTPIRLILAVHEKRMGLFLYLFFHVFMAFAVLESMITLYLSLRFGADELDAALVFAWIGFFVAITQGVLLRRLVPMFGEIRLVAAGFVLMTLGLGAVAFVPSFGWFFVIGPIVAVGNGLAFPTFTSLYSKACESEQAGELLGQSQSMATTGRIVGPLWAGAVMGSVGLGAPFELAALLMLAALVLFIATRRLLVDAEDEQQEGS